MVNQPISKTHLSDAPEEGRHPSLPEVADTRTVRSEDLFAGHRVVLIQHGDEQYRLLITRNDRLILQK